MANTAQGHLLTKPDCHQLQKWKCGKLRTPHQAHIAPPPPSIHLHHAIPICAAVYFEKGDYETCIKVCDEAVEKANEFHSGGQVLAKCAFASEEELGLTDPFALHLVPR